MNDCLADITDTSKKCHICDISVIYPWYTFQDCQGFVKEVPICDKCSNKMNEFVGNFDKENYD